jgi:hypothetical protein
MKRIFICLLLFSSLLSHAQNPFRKWEISAGVGFTRPLGTTELITFQSGTLIEMEFVKNFLLKNNNRIYFGIGSSYQNINIEGYFRKENENDIFLITPNNIKVNSLVWQPVYLKAGYGGLIKKSLVFGLGTKLNYSTDLIRRFKTDDIKFEETYSFQKKINWGASGSLGFLLSGQSKSRIDFTIDYMITSMANNTGFHPLQIGFRYTRGLGK